MKNIFRYLVLALVLFSSYTAHANYPELQVPASSNGAWYDLHKGKAWCISNNIDMGISVANLCEFKFKFVKSINGERQSFKTMKGDIFVFSPMGIILMRGDHSLMTYDFATKEVSFEVDQSTLVYAPTKPIGPLAMPAVPMTAHKVVPTTKKIATATAPIIEKTSKPLVILATDTFNFDSLPTSFSYSKYLEEKGRDKNIAYHLSDSGLYRFLDEWHAESDGEIKFHSKTFIDSISGLRQAFVPEPVPPQKE